MVLEMRNRTEVAGSNRANCRYNLVVKSDKDGPSYSPINNQFPRRSAASVQFCNRRIRTRWNNRGTVAARLMAALEKPILCRALSVSNWRAASRRDVSNSLNFSEIDWTSVANEAIALVTRRFGQLLPPYAGR